MVEVKQVLGDPKFHALPIEERRKVLVTIDPNFAGLPTPEQDKVLGAVAQPRLTDPAQEPETPQAAEEGFELRGMDKQLAELGAGVREAIGNVPKSGARFVEDLITPLLAPEETARAIGNLAVGTAQKLIPGKQDKEVFADQMVDFVKQRYGSWENFKKTLVEDPVGVTADVASLVTGAGATVRGVGAAGKVKRISDVGRAITKTGAAIEPLSVARKVTTGTARAFLPKELPSKLYQSSTKFSTTLTEQQRAAITKTALDHEIMPSIKGLDKIRTRVNELNDQITKLIDDATETGQTIPIKKLFSEFGQLNKEATLSGTPINSQRQIYNIRNQITEANKKIGRDALTPKEAQALKQQIYKETETYYGKVTEHPASIKAQQAVARAAKESLEEIFPEIRELNKREGALLELNKAIEKSASRISNRDIMGIGVPIKGTVGGVAAGAEGIAAGVALGLLDTPLVKAKLAIILNRVKQKGIKISPTSGFVTLGLFQSGRAKTENE